VLPSVPVAFWNANIPFHLPYSTFFTVGAVASRANDVTESVFLSILKVLRPNEPGASFAFITVYQASKS